MSDATASPRCPICGVAGQVCGPHAPEASFLFVSGTTAGNWIHRPRTVEETMLKTYDVDDGTGRTVSLRLTAAEAKARGLKAPDKQVEEEATTKTEEVGTKQHAAPLNKARTSDSKGT